MAIRSSVTVSIGELKKGVLRMIFRVTLRELSNQSLGPLREKTDLVCRETTEAGKEI